LHIYAIYYGWLIADAGGEPSAAAQRIASTRVPLLIANLWTAAPERHLNINPKVLALMREARTLVYAYVATAWGRARSATVERQVLECLDAGVDGVFFDEADPLIRDDHERYYDALAQLVWSRGGALILNPGVAQCGEALMKYANAIMVEHHWRSFPYASLWMRRYPKDRVMGVSSNEENAMGYTVDEQRAIEDTRQAWRSGIGWHASTGHYVDLPPWFERYASSLMESA
jgi:hypothetical protein